MQVLKMVHSRLIRTRVFVVVGIGMVLLSGCEGGGSNTDVGQTIAGQASTIDSRNLSGVALPGDPSKLKPVARVARDRYGIVGSFPLADSDIDNIAFPNLSDEERSAYLSGLQFFSIPHTAEEGAGPAANQPFCLGCHRNSEESLAVDDRGNQLVTTSSPAGRAGRATPTNFAFTAFDPSTGGGRAPDNLDAMRNTGQTAAFTVFGDFSPASGNFFPLVTNQGGVTGFVQHVRPTIAECLPAAILPPEADPAIFGPADPSTGASPVGMRRAVGERAGPPYMGRGLMEAIIADDISALDDSVDTKNGVSSLNKPSDFQECRNDCISGRHNEANAATAFAGGDPVVRLARFGLRAAGPTLMQFVNGGAQTEIGLTTPFGMTEINNVVNVDRPGCQDRVGDPEVPAETILDTRTLIRLTAVPEFGQPLLSLLESPDPTAAQIPGSESDLVQRGAQLFGVDLVAFANRMIPGRMPSGGDGLDDHAINQADRMLDCAGCHTPVFATGQSPAEVGADHLSNVWAPIFADLLLHAGPTVSAERNAATPRAPLQLIRTDGSGRSYTTFDISRNLSDDALPNQGLANGTEFRTAPLMGIGRLGPPLLHDGRVYLSNRTVDTTPAGTVTTNSSVTNAPLVVRTFDDALLATIELHDLPAPDDGKTFQGGGGGCPLAPRRVADDVCPSYSSATSRSNRGEARKSIKRFRDLSAGDQQALVEFLKQL